MKNISFHEKIKKLFFWEALFLIFFFIFSLVLSTSNFETHVTLPKMYELLKDLLTINAAFLAPIVAFILFSDWREQYNIQVIDKYLIDLMIQLKDMEILLNRKSSNPDDNLFNNILKSTFEIRFELKHIILILNIYHDYIDKDFLKKIESFEELSLKIDDIICEQLRKKEEKKIGDDERPMIELIDDKANKLNELVEIKKFLEVKIREIRLSLLNKSKSIRCSDS